MRRIVGRYATAVVAVVATAGIRQLLDPLLGSDAPMLVFVLAVVIAAVQGGVAAGMVATALSLPIGAFLFIEPRLAFTPMSSTNVVRLAVFTIEGMLIAYAAGQLRTQLEANRGLTETVRRHSEELEQQVERRTRELQSQAAELEASNEALETFAHTISHDIRAPLRSIRGFAEILHEEFVSTLPAPARDYTTRLAAAAHRLERLVDNLLAYTRLGRRAVPAEVVSLDRVIAAAIAQLEDDISKAGASIALPEHPLGAVIGNADVIELMMTNLISNAVKFVPPGETPHVTIRTESRDGAIRVVVRDHGIGVPLEDQKTLFKPFERLHSHQDYAGTGLGLALVARGAERMQGAYGMSSDGKGSEFWIELPAAQRGNQR